MERWRDGEMERWREKRWRDGEMERREMERRERREERRERVTLADIVVGEPAPAKETFSQSSHITACPLNSTKK